jgi:hypothetical protein
MSRSIHDPRKTQVDGIIGYVYVGGKQTTLRLSMVLGKALNVTGETAKLLMIQGELNGERKASSP